MLILPILLQQIYIMNSTERPSGSTKYKILVLATLNYLMDRHTGEFVYDGFDPVKQYYEEQKIQAEKYHRQGNLQKLKKQFKRLSQGIINRADTEFTPYIKEKTGYDLDIFTDLRKTGEGILSRGTIQSEKESHTVSHLMHLYSTTNEDPQKEMLLLSLLSAFHEKGRSSKKSDEEHSRIVHTEEKDGIIVETVEIIVGPKPQHHHHRTIPSPDGQRSLYITEWSDGRQASTGVGISFKTASGGIYEAEGIHPDIDAFWKDNHTVLIQTSKSYTVHGQCRKIESFGDVVSIEYDERD